MFLDSSGGIRDHLLITEHTPGVPDWSQGDFCGFGGPAGIEDWNFDGVPDFLLGCPDRNSAAGSLFLFTMQSQPAVPRPSACGDLILDIAAGEECESPNSTYCDSNCKISCGDGVVQANEVCDDGVANSDVIPNACRSSCNVPICGDLVLDTGEECDPGYNEFCDERCQFRCSNGFVDFNEECDDGNLNNGDGCSSICEIE